ncbi:hypothetical protein COL940_011267 [Colletotrichum noveboracense]|nr:hypothetical protein COL940_011267 [Colletotrichum noveboracense]KAJ0277114.1 hypothetical protein CBS470a_010459 [Colletotrichum nupharicola]
MDMERVETEFEAGSANTFDDTEAILPLGVKGSEGYWFVCDADPTLGCKVGQSLQLWYDYTIIVCRMLEKLRWHLDELCTGCDSKVDPATSNVQSFFQRCTEVSFEILQGIQAENLKILRRAEILDLSSRFQRRKTI